MESQRDYLHRRAEEEDAAAYRASSEKARELHQELATRYRDAAGTTGEVVAAGTVNSTQPKDSEVLE